MTLQFIEGGAGTGKTTTVIVRLAHLLTTSPLGEHQRVLALTRMHGSRRRVRERLGNVAGLNGRFDSVTIDSFAWRVVRRWRSLARVIAGPPPTEFNESCEHAGRLLEDPRVQMWVASTFPIVIVDELQDSKDGQLRVLRGLSTRCECIVAGDWFQDLNGEGICPSIEWARQHGVSTTLGITHRTHTPGLLAAATAFRDGQPVAVAPGFTIRGVDAYALGAWEAALKIASWSRHDGSIAVITPVTPGRSTFVRQLVERVSSKPIGKQRPIGPFKLFWEAGYEDQVERICSAAGLPDDDDVVVHVGSLALDVGRGRMLRDWLARQRRLFGRREFRSGDVRDAVKQLVQQRRGHVHHGERWLSAMSVHQAKNREFDRVIVLWPYEAAGNDEHRRRLAYNAITRARHEAHVIVQNPARIAQSPFVPNVGIGSISRRRRAGARARGKVAGSA